MPETPQISVVMAVYNGAAALPATLDSILSQQGVELEFIVVNDGSTDETGHILARYSSRDTRLRVFEQENQGLTRSLIRGCAEARGEFIARQDCGDVSLPGRLAAQRDMFLENHELAFVSCWTKYVGPENEFLFVTKGTGVASAPMYILSVDEEWGVIDGPSCHPSVMFRSDAYAQRGGYRPEFYYGQDWDLWYRLASAGRFQMCLEVMYVAQIAVGSISMGAQKKQEQVAKLSHKALLARIQGREDSEYLEKACRIRSDNLNKGLNWGKASGFYFIGECLRRNKDLRARRYFVQSLLTNPFFGRCWIRLFQMSLCSFSKIFFTWLVK